MDYYDEFEYEDERVSFPTVGEIIQYTVKRGDNIFRVAKRFNTEMNWIFAMNDLNRNSMIFPGQQLLIPVLFQKPMPFPKPNPMPPRPQPRSSLERNEYDMYF